MTSFVLSGCAGKAEDSRSVVYEDMKAAFDEWDN